MKEVKASIILIFICAVACFGVLFLTGGCDVGEITPQENALFKSRVKFIESIPSSSNAANPRHIVSFLEIDNHRYIFYCNNPGMNGAVGGMVHDPECKCHGEKK